MALISHPDLPGVVKDVHDDAVEQYALAGWVDAYPEPEVEPDEDSDDEPTDEDDQ